MDEYDLKVYVHKPFLSHLSPNMIKENIRKSMKSERAQNSIMHFFFKDIEDRFHHFRCHNTAHRRKATGNFGI